MEDLPNPVTKEVTKKILDQINNSMYKFITEEGKIEYGYFCYIKSQNKNIQLIIINNYDINKIENGKINVSINITSELIELGYIRYYNKKLNMSIIEIKGNINNSNINFFEIDDDLYENGVEFEYNKKSIYIIQYNNINNISVSYGIINNINKKQLFYLANINTNSKISFIFNLSNNKLLGIHEIKSKHYNKGLFFSHIIEFVNKYKKLNKYKDNQYSNNEIDISINVSNKEVNKDVYFLSNNEKDNFTELNESNAEIIINDIKYKYAKYFKPEREGEYNIKLKFNINLTDCSYMFANCKNIKNINFISFNTRYIINMKYMFYRCENLNSINLLSFDTKNVTDMSYMFFNCSNLNNLNLSSFNTEHVTDMSYMFFYCNKLNNLDLFNFNTKKVTNMNNMFSCCNFRDLNLSSFDTKNVTNMSYMFFSCSNLNNLNLSSFNTKNVTNMNNMFCHCNLTNINLSSFNTEKVTSMNNMFSYCNNLRNLNLSSFDTRNVINMKNMFSGCSNLNDLNLSSFDTKNVTEINSIFYGCNKKIIDTNYYVFRKFYRSDLI